MTTAALPHFGQTKPPGAVRRFRHGAGLAITAIGALLLAVQAVAPSGIQRWPGGPPAVAFQAGMVAALATAAGAFPVLLAKRVSARATDAMLGFGAGVMLAATAFSLILPALAASGGLGLGRWQSATRPGADTSRIWLFVAAITLHNIPEGLAIGVAFGQDGGGATVAGGIALQDIPEGLVVAAALVGAGFNRVTATLVAAATGLAEPVAALVGAGVVMDLPAILPWALAFAAGAMLFVVSHEIIPESHKRGHESLATTGLVAGFCLMMVLDTAWADCGRTGPFHPQPRGRNGLRPRRDNSGSIPQKGAQGRQALIQDGVR